MEQLSALIPQFLLDEINARGGSVQDQAPSLESKPISGTLSNRNVAATELVTELNGPTLNSTILSSTNPDGMNNQPGVQLNDTEAAIKIAGGSFSENGFSQIDVTVEKDTVEKDTVEKDTVEKDKGKKEDSDQQELVSLFRAGWIEAKQQISLKIDPGLFLAWIKPLAFLDVNARLAAGVETYEVLIGAPNRFSTEHVTRRYTSLIIESIAAAIGLEPTVASSTLVLKVGIGRGENGASPTNGPVSGFLGRRPVEKNSNGEIIESRDIENRGAEETVTGGRGPAARSSRTSTEAENRKTAAHRREADTNQANECGLNPKYNFSNFVVGGCNQFAHAICLRVSEDLGGNYNPLFIYGGVGLGKTHLANAIGNASRRRGKRVLLVSSELFVSELISGLRSNKMQQFKNRFRSLDLLIIDDIQFIIGKERTQEEFFHTFNELHQKHKQIVMTSDKMPQDLIGLEERLKTRFSSGISADLQAPDFETRVAILIRKSEQSSIQLPVEVARLLAERIDTNVRELEGALNRIQAFSSLYQQPITVDLAQSVLKTVAPEKNREVSPEQIQRLVGERFSIGMGDIIGKRRTQNIALARQVAMYLCRKLTPSSYPEIGALFGGRDHSTVIHANKVIEERIRNDEQFGKDVQALERRLRG